MEEIPMDNCQDSSPDSKTPSPDKKRAGGNFTFLPYNNNLTARARENRKNPTPGRKQNLE